MTRTITWSACSTKQTIEGNQKEKPVLRVVLEQHWVRGNLRPRKIVGWKPNEANTRMCLIWTPNKMPITYILNDDRQSTCRRLPTLVTGVSSLHLNVTLCSGGLPIWAKSWNKKKNKTKHSIRARGQKVRGHTYIQICDAESHYNQLIMFNVCTTNPFSYCFEDNKMGVVWKWLPAGEKFSVLLPRRGL